MRSDELVEAMELLHQYPRLIAERAAAEAVASLTAEKDGIIAALVEAMERGHYQDHGDQCQGCRHNWPCPDYGLLRAVAPAAAERDRKRDEAAAEAERDRLRDELTRRWRPEIYGLQEVLALLALP